MLKMMKKRFTAEGAAKTKVLGKGSDDPPERAGKRS